MFNLLPSLLLFFVALFTATSSFAFEQLANSNHLELLRQGGLVIYMRHGSTDAHFPDQIPVDLENCSSQRPLSAEGRKELDAIGKNFARLNLPFHTVISSPFCRAIESSKRVFGEDLLEVDLPLRYTASMPTKEKQPAVERTLYWISLPVKQAKSNRVVVAHGPNVAEIMDYLPSEATMVIFRPLGESKFEYLASIPPHHWPALLKELK